MNSSFADVIIWTLPESPSTTIFPVFSEEADNLFFCSGTFARVCLCRHKTSSNFFALKILSLHDVIRLKQVDHVKNEKNILKVAFYSSSSSVRGDFADGH